MLHGKEHPLKFPTPEKIAGRRVYVDATRGRCAGCEGHVKTAVGKLPGILETRVSFEQGRAVVRFDEPQTTAAAISPAVDETGYRVTQSQMSQN